MAFVSSYTPPRSNGQAVAILGSRISVAAGTGTILSVPSSTSHLIVNCGDSRYWGEYGLLPTKLILFSTVDYIAKNSSGSDGGILSLNPDSEFIPKIMSAKKRYYTSSDSSRPYPLVIAHLSDVHGNWNNVARFLEFTEHHTPNIDLLLNTGDLVSSYYSDGIDGYVAINGTENILNVIGNHDTRGTSSGMAQWTDHVGADAYNVFIEPFVSNWDVVQPTNADTNGYCYYYKDFTEQGIRLVAVDIMAYDLTEDSWLASVLSGALSSGLHVVIAVHYAGVRSTSEKTEAVFTKINVNYTTLYSVGGNSENLTEYNTGAYRMMDTVNTFIQSGGHFIGYIQGHYHADFVAKCAKYPDQLIFSIGATKAGEMRDYDHAEGTRNQDEFQIIAIDTVGTIVKLFKVGAHIDRYGRSKSSLCINYSTCEVVGEGY